MWLLRRWGVQNMFLLSPCKYYMNYNLKSDDPDPVASLWWAWEYKGFRGIISCLCPLFQVSNRESQLPSEGKGGFGRNSWPRIRQKNKAIREKRYRYVKRFSYVGTLFIATFMPIAQISLHFWKFCWNSHLYRRNLLEKIRVSGNELNYKQGYDTKQFPFAVIYLTPPPL